MRLRPLLAQLSFTLAACRGGAGQTTGLTGATLEITTAATIESSGEASGSSEGTSEAAHTDASTDGASSTSEPARDLPSPDFGDGKPPGCRGKIDFLFVLSRRHEMKAVQERLLAAFPQFIATIESRFADFDHHIMVTKGDDGWGDSLCNDSWCAHPGCTFGDACCPLTESQGPDDKPCCANPDTYPCADIDLLTQCDRAWGAGVVFPAGIFTQNRPCPVEGGRRYLVKGQTDLPGTFACIATVGDRGWDAVGQAFTAAMQRKINEPGGCNKGFLRDDALLMVTFISGTDEKPGGSEGYPFQWAEAALDAKHGDAGSIVMLSLGYTKTGAECDPVDRICEMVDMFPYRHREGLDEPDYGPAFAEAAALVDTACAGFVPPG
jgi:hypothetical protein